MSEAAAAVETPPAKGGGSSRLVPIMLITNFVVMLGGGAFLYLKTAHAASSAGAKAEAEAEAGKEGEGGEGGPAAAGPTVRLADFVIHLRNPEADRYARISFELELGSEADKTFLTPYLPRLRDAFISYLSDRTAEELRGSEGLARVKRDLLKQIDDLVPGRHVQNLYIADFVIQ